MSDVAARWSAELIRGILSKKEEAVLGLATGNSPTGLYKRLARAFNAGELEAGRFRSFSLDGYIGLPGENAQQRVLHPESYCYFMIQEFFSLLKRKFKETCVPYGSLVDQGKLEAELSAHPGDFSFEGNGAGKALWIKPDCASPYLRWIREEIQESPTNGRSNSTEASTFR